MSNIVDALRAWADLVEDGLLVPAASKAMRDAANEIERLRADLATARRDERERCAGAAAVIREMGGGDE